jgi:hypothetical protein
MEFNLGNLSFQLSETQCLSVFWACTVALAFNAAYLLFVLDHKRPRVTWTRIAMTVFIGSLIVVGTYADALAAKPFAMKDCLLLALVAAHGWMAEALVQSFLANAEGKRPIAPSIG